MVKLLLALAVLSQSPPTPDPDPLPPPAEASEPDIDRGDVPPPPMPRATPLIAQQSPPRPVQVHVTQDPPPGPAAAPDGVQHVVFHLVQDPRPQPTPSAPYASPQAQIAAAELVPTAAVTTTTSRVHHPGLVRRTLGRVGERLAEVGKPWTRIPPVTTAVVTQTVHQVTVQQPSAAHERVYASPQGSR